MNRLHSKSFHSFDNQCLTTSTLQLNVEIRENYRKTTTENVFSHPSYREMIAEIVRAKEQVQERKLAEKRKLEEALRKQQEEEEALRRELAKVKVPVENRKHQFSNSMQFRKKVLEEKESSGGVPSCLSILSKNFDLLKPSNITKIVRRQRPRRSNTIIMDGSPLVVQLKKTPKTPKTPTPKTPHSPFIQS